MSLVFIAFVLVVGAVPAFSQGTVQSDPETGRRTRGDGIGTAGDAPAVPLCLHPM